MYYAHEYNLTNYEFCGIIYVINTYNKEELIMENRLMCFAEWLREGFNEDYGESVEGYNILGILKKYTEDCVRITYVSSMDFIRYLESCNTLYKIDSVSLEEINAKSYSWLNSYNHAGRKQEEVISEDEIKQFVTMLCSGEVLNLTGNVRINADGTFEFTLKGKL